MKATTAPREPYVSLKLPKLAAYHENSAETTIYMTAAIPLVLFDSAQRHTRSYLVRGARLREYPR